MNSNDNNPPIIQMGHIEIDATRFVAEPSFDELPLLPTRNLVLFPGVSFPVNLVRHNSLTTARLASERAVPVGLVCQSSPDADTPAIPMDLMPYGVVVDVLKVLDLPDDTHTAIVRARGKFKIIEQSATSAIPEAELAARVKPVSEQNARANDPEFNAALDMIRKSVHNILESMGNAQIEQAIGLDNLTDPAIFVNTVATHAPIEVKAKGELLARHRIKDRAIGLYAELSRSEEMVNIARSIRERARQSISEQQRNHFLQQQMEEMRQELYGDQDEPTQLQKRAEEAKLPEHVMKVFNKEIEKLRRLNPQTPDWSVQISYLETLLDLPWHKESEPQNDFNHAEEVLDSEHYGLEKVKERILEQLAVIINTGSMRSPIICLVGPPGVGKTSLGRSIAGSLGREYQRVSLGGMHDEAELRGHRRTYIGAMPGRIVDALRRAGTCNPVLLLDEIDKVGADYKGDPTAALLEVLDPEQNCRFHDNYVDVDFDLSKVLFIATANTLSTIPRPLLDRMEVIDISGYLLEEKVEIARRHLIPRIFEEYGISVEIPDETIAAMIENYTSESGVRQLEKVIAKAVRKVLVAKLRKHRLPHSITVADLKDYLGVAPYSRDRYEGNDFPGVVTGLAWTSAGGEILYIESSLAQGKGDKLVLTGNLGNVMKESATIALQYVRSHASDLGIDPERFENTVLHIHVPEGAIPKDGPSAGITMATSIASAFTGRKVKPRLAMTGEITLRGRVLPVGGIKEKILAAKRAGITTIVLSEENRKNIEEIKPVYRKGLRFHYVKTADEVLDFALI